MKKLLAISTIALGLVFATLVPVSAADSPEIVSNTPYTATISKVGDIWKGNVPSKVTYPTGSYSAYIEFPINGIVPIAKLRDGLTGVTVDFEIWNSKGKKIGYDTVYSSDWNPVGPDTLVSIYISEADALGTHSLLIRTKYELRGNGLVTEYLKQEDVKQIQITKKPVAPTAPTEISGSWNGTNLDYTFVASASDLPIIRYEIGIADSLPGVTEANRSFYDPIVLKSVTSERFTLTPTDFLTKSTLPNLMVLVKVRAVSAAGTSPWSSGIYTLVESLKKNGFSKIPPSAETSCDVSTEGMNYTAKVLYSSAVLWSGTPTAYSWKYRLLKDGLEPTSRSNYGDPQVASKTGANAVTFTRKEMLSFAKQDESATILFTVVPSSSYGDSGTEGKGCYVSVKQLIDDWKYFDEIAKAKVDADAKAAADKLAAEQKAKADADKLAAEQKAKAEADRIAAEVKAKQDAETKAKLDAEAKAAADALAAQKAAAMKKVTITCVKGKLTKKVTAVKPKCPAGYKKK